MAYTLTQARSLLTVPELALFDYSRAGPIKELTAARLRGKVTRARSLRDKYRDLYRRQTVAMRGSKQQRSAAGTDNERTEKKATIFVEVLERFETRLAHLESQPAKKAGAAKSPAKAPSRKPLSSAEPKKAAARKPGTRAKVRRINLKAAVKKALELKHAAAAATTHAGPVIDRSSKAPATFTPQAGGPTAPTAPLDMSALAARLNPLKERAENIALHAHSGSQNRHSQGKRDAR